MFSWNNIDDGSNRMESTLIMDTNIDNNINNISDWIWNVAVGPKLVLQGC